MAHRRVPRAMKRAMFQEARNEAPYLMGTMAGESSKVRGLVSRDNVTYLAPLREQARQWNWLPDMSIAAIEEVNNTIDRRYESAAPVTDAQSEKMERLERLYNGEWENKEHEDEERIFLAKGREALQVVSAFLYGMLLQVPKLLEFRPAPTTLIGLKEAWRSAKLSEALTNYHFDDLWKIRHTVLRDYTKVFLKFSTGIIRTDYFPSMTQPDLRFAVVDRALQFFDPYAHKIKECKWWIEKEFWERSAVEDMFKMGHWIRPKDLPDIVPSVMSTASNDATLRRFFGSIAIGTPSIEADELVEVRKYIQAPGRGLEHRYACQLGGTGGWLVGYGPNPSPYKGIPYSGDSFDRHEWQIDGKGLLEMHQALNEVINTLLNLRLDDVKQNIWSPSIVPEDLINDQTLDDIENRAKLVRGDKDVIASYVQLGKRLQDYVMPLPINAKSSEAVYQDIAFAMGQSDRAGHSGDVFRGQSPSKVTTAQEIHEVLSNNQGVFQPAFMSIMQVVEDMGEIANAYFRNPDFYGEERIMLATGGRYEDVVKQWDFDSDGLRAARVSFDQMNQDVTIRATNGAEAMLARTFKAAVVKDLIASIGQVEGLFPELQDRFDLVPIIIDMFRGVVADVDSFERTPEQIKQRQEERAQRSQQGLAQQTQLATLAARAKEEAKADGQIKAAQGAAAAEASRDALRISQESEAKMRELLAEHSAAERHELRVLLLEHVHTMKEMMLEQKLEIEAAKAAPKSSVGGGGNRVNT